VAESGAGGDTPEFAPGSERILVVEDDPDVREIPVAILRNQGYEVVEAADGMQAIDHLKAGPRFDLLFTDVVLPGGMNGAEVAREVQRLQPDIKVVYTTGYAEHALARNGDLEPGMTLITKPYSRAELLETVRTALGGGD
jgi:CheY-like chemotaxis protein